MEACYVLILASFSLTLVSESAFNAASYSVELESAAAALATISTVRFA